MNSPGESLERLRPALHRLDQPPPAGAALTASLLPLAGVLLLDWSAAAMIGFYWAENVVIGAFHFLKLRAARGQMLDPAFERALASNPNATPEQRQAQIETTQRIQHAIMPWLFLVHFGLFCLGHAAVIAFLLEGAFADLDTLPGLIVLGAMAVQQGLVLRRFRADPELVALPRAIVMFQPYARLVVLHLVLLLAALPMLAGYHLVAAVLLAAVKCAAELGGVFSLRAVFERAAERSLRRAAR